jgi:hypothetical protein
LGPVVLIAANKEDSTEHAQSNSLPGLKIEFQYLQGRKFEQPPPALSKLPSGGTDYCTGDSGEGWESSDFDNEDEVSDLKGGV